MINLGSLYAKIEADTSGLNKATGAIKKFSSTAATTFGIVTKAALATTTAIAGISVGAAAMVNSVAKQTKELSYLSQQAGTSVEDLLALGYATESVGVNAEKLADISKDVFDKLGDYVAGKGGEFKDFFENIGNKAGISAKKLLKLSGPEALGAIKNALDKANLSAKEQVFYMESIANDASRLIPLLADNSKKLKEMSNRAKELGLSLSTVQVEQLLKASTATKELGAAFEALKLKVSSSLAPIYTIIAERLTGAMQKFNAEVNTSTITRWAKTASIAILDFSKRVIEGFGVFYMFAKNLQGVLNLAYASTLKLAKGVMWLFEQSNKLFNDDVKAKKWADVQVETAKMIEEAFASASESFSSAADPIDTSKIVTEIDKLKQSIKDIDENAIEKSINKPLKDINKGSLDDMHKNFEGVWVNGGKKADTALGSIEKKMKQIKLDAKDIDSIIADWASKGAPSGPSSQGKKLGGIIQKMKDGGAVIKAQAGRFFPGFGGGDKIPILGEAGEYMLNKFAVRSASPETADAFNRQDWRTVVSNLTDKMGVSQSAMPAMATASSSDTSSATPRQYFVGNDPTPISVNADDSNANRLMKTLKNRYNRRS